jgi:hypothetical protein
MSVLQKKFEEDVQSIQESMLLEQQEHPIQLGVNNIDTNNPSPKSASKSMFEECANKTLADGMSVESKISRKQDNTLRRSVY